jgi:hypothetical protein
MRWRFPPPQRIAKPSNRDWELIPPEPLLFPADLLEFPSERLDARVPAGAILLSSASLIEWTIFLDDSPSTSGVITLADLENRSW